MHRWFVLGFLVAAQFIGESAHPQSVLAGCPGRVVRTASGGMGCQCPDGSLANGSFANGQLIYHCKASAPLPQAAPSSTPIYVFKNPLGAGASGAVTQSFGKPWSGNASLRHTGVDIASLQGAPVMSTSDGTVAKVGWLGCKGDHTGTKPQSACPGRDENWGNYVVVRKQDGSAAAYLHVDPASGLREGGKVQNGTVVGSVYKDHLHYNECRSVDGNDRKREGCQRGAVEPELLSRANTNFLEPKIPK